MAKMPNWIARDEVVGYIILSYQGLDEVPTRPNLFRRVFMWEEDGDIKMGNTEAFTLHLGKKFDLPLNAGHASMIHMLLRDLGELVKPHSKHAQRQMNGPKAGRFRQPDPEEWSVASAPTPSAEAEEGAD